MAGLAKEKRTPVTGVDFCQQLMERHPALVAWMILPAQSDVGVFPLVRVIIIESHDIQVFGMPTQVRFHLASHHIPGFELAGALGGCLLCQFRMASGRDNMDQRLDLYNPCFW